MERTILVTGATDGIGLETAKELARAGHRVIVHGRRPDRVEAARRAVPGSEGVVFDLGRFADVRKGAEEIGRRFPRLDVLLNNAGIYANERVLTADGHESTFQVNHLAPFLLTRLLLDGPLRGPGARIVNVSSIAHTRGRMHFDDLDFARGWNAYGAYAQSKLANVLFTLSLAEKLDPAEITANALHPGVVGTKLLREGFGMNGNESLAEGAATSVLLASSDELAGVTGEYFVRGQAVSPAAQALVEADRRTLWEISERLTGLEAR